MPINLTSCFGGEHERKGRYRFYRTITLVGVETQQKRLFYGGLLCVSVSLVPNDIDAVSTRTARRSTYLDVFRDFIFDPRFAPPLTA